MCSTHLIDLTEPCVTISLGRLLFGCQHPRYVFRGSCGFLNEIMSLIVRADIRLS